MQGVVTGSTTDSLILCLRMASATTDIVLAEASIPTEAINEAVQE